MNVQTIESLRPFAHYIWWKSADETLRLPERLIAQVMDIGMFEDTRLLTQIVSEEELRSVLTHAEIGQFRPKSWHYWHYCLGLAQPGQVPPMPVRKTG